MHPNSHVPRFYNRQVIEELERREPLVQHASKILSTERKEPDAKN